MTSGVAVPSPSSRRAWIEILGGVWVEVMRPQVALLAEGVDRNFLTTRAVQLLPCVALLAEGVDRNPLAPYV